MRHGDFLTVMTIVNDPVYLTEPFIRTTDYELDLHQLVAPVSVRRCRRSGSAKGLRTELDARNKSRP